MMVFQVRKAFAVGYLHKRVEIAIGLLGVGDEAADISLPPCKLLRGTARLLPGERLKAFIDLAVLITLPVVLAWVVRSRSFKVLEAPCSFKLVGADRDSDLSVDP